MQQNFRLSPYSRSELVIVITLGEGLLDLYEELLGKALESELSDAGSSKTDLTRGVTSTLCKHLTNLLDSSCSKYRYELNI
jgi:hypothetical protein